MATISEKLRKKTATVHSGGKAKFPIPDKSHAANALARLNQAKPPLSSAQKAKVRAKAQRVLGKKKKKKTGLKTYASQRGGY